MKYDFNREAAKIPALSFWKVDKFEYFTGGEILSSSQRPIIEQAQFAYFPLGKAFEKQIEKQLGSLKSLCISNKKDGLKQIEGMFPQNGEC